jgi:GT2 family glycosyltransferase
MALEPRKDVVKEGASFVALSSEPWLAIVPTTPFEKPGFLRLSYAIREGDAPTRPILRYWFGPEIYREHLLPAPHEGVGLWIGRVPGGCTDVWISPTNRPGAFDFSLIDIAPANIRDVFNRLRRFPKRLFFAVAAGLVGLGEESDLNWRWALGSEPITSYPAWRRERRSRKLAEPSPQPDIKSSARFWFFVDLDGASSRQIDASCASIERQSLKHWRARLVGTPADRSGLERKAAWEKKSGFDSQEQPRATDFLARLCAGDVVHEDAVACFDAHFCRHPEHRLAYCDEIRGDADQAAPVFKPGWSPTLHLSYPYIGRAAFFRAIDDAAGADEFAAGLSPCEAGALRLPLFEFPEATAPSLKKFDAVCRDARPSVSIVIPTRDKADLLKECLQSLFERTSYGNFDVVLVDNDSAEPQALKLIQDFEAAHERLKVVRFPGDFNFSRLSNAGAQACAGEFLLFLNNDTQIISPDWIERLLYFARQPDKGAVGAKLLYPNRRTQHVGVLLGMGGVAGHFGAGLDESEPGWWGRNLAPHEVSAVTGACLMVARSKFEAVDRFDEINLPVDLNDVDLCLRLAERGWRTICHSQVVLIHHQSASRGGGLRLQQVYERERRFFRERWRAVIRDDPYFHPGLSLYATTEMLP